MLRQCVTEAHPLEMLGVPVVESWCDSVGIVQACDRDVDKAGYVVSYKRDLRATTSTESPGGFG
jgi:hypothetical protein